MITIDQLATAARAAENQPHPTRICVREHGLVIEAHQQGLVAETLVPWSDLADGSNVATDRAFHANRTSMEKGLADQKRALDEAAAA